MQFAYNTGYLYVASLPRAQFDHEPFFFLLLAWTPTVFVRFLYSVFFVSFPLFSKCFIPKILVKTSSSVCRRISGVEMSYSSIQTWRKWSAQCNGKLFIYANIAVLLFTDNNDFAFFLFIFHLWKWHVWKFVMIQTLCVYLFALYFSAVWQTWKHVLLAF